MQERCMLSVSFKPYIYSDIVLVTQRLTATIPTAELAEARDGWFQSFLWMIMASKRELCHSRGTEVLT